MSVLFLRRRQSSEVAHQWRPCDNGCISYGGGGGKTPVSAHWGRRSAHWEAEIRGLHAAWLCDKCKEAWRSWWPGAGGGVPVVDGRRDGRAFEEAA